MMESPFLQIPERLLYVDEFFGPLLLAECSCQIPGRGRGTGYAPPALPPLGRSTRHDSDHELNHAGTFLFTVERPFDSFHLSPDPPNATQELRLVLGRVSHSPTFKV
jgi:hypothetical protein